MTNLGEFQIEIGEESNLNKENFYVMLPLW